MIARLTRLLLLAQIIVAGGLAALFHGAGLGWRPALLAGFGAVLALRMLITLNNFFVARAFAGPVPPEHRLSPRQGIAMYLREFGATGTASSWSMPFRTFRRREAAPGPFPAALPVLLVHGYACNSGYWTRMSETLAQAGIRHHAIDLEPIGGSIDEYAAPIEAALRALCEESGSAQAIVVAHSMGGLATRAYIRAHGSARLAGVVTLGTPHHGTGLALFGPGENSRQMRWHGRHGVGEPGAWLTRLAAEESAQTRRLFTSIWTWHDNIVSPPTSCIYPDARNVALHGIGHVALGRHPRVMAMVVEEIRRLSAAASRG